MPVSQSKKPRFSPQRELVFQIVNHEHSHLSAHEIFKRAKKKHPKISKATVYRNLEQLEELQAISAMQGPLGITYYEVFAEPHHHFVCRVCRKIQNLETPNVNICTSCITKKSPIKIEKIVTTLFGVCEKCAK